MISAVLLVLAMQVMGCSTPKSLYRKVRPEKPGLKKRMLVLPILDRAGLGEEKAAALTAAFMERLAREDRFLLQKGPAPTIPAPREGSPTYTFVPDPALMQRAAAAGLNLLVAGVLNPLEITSRKIGWWPLRFIRRQAEVSLLVNAYDLIDGTLLVTHLASRKLKVSGDLPQREGGLGNVDEERLAKALTRILEDQVDTLTEKLGKEPWRGRLLSVEGETLRISAGRDVGLTPGTLFEVLGRGEPIRASNGRTYYLPGPKVGEIEAVRVEEKEATAVPRTGNHFEVGQVIRAK